MLKTNIFFRVAQLHPPHLLGGSICRLVITENDLRPAGQRWNAANSVFNVSFLVFAWDDYRYGKIFRRNWRWNHSRNDHLRHAELAHKRQARAKTVQESRQQRQILGKKN